MYQVVKRNGKTVDFDIHKISAAITKAFDALGKQYHPSVIELISMHVAADFETKIHDGKITVEEIQDSVEKVLSQSGYADVAKAYILYRKQREKVRNVGSTALDYKELVDGYLKVDDWRVKENATVTYSIGGLILSNSGAITANYWLSEVYDDEIAEAHRSAALHLHDLSMLTGYCFTGDTRVKTLDGKNPTFKDLVDNHVQELWVYAYDLKNEVVVPAKAVAPRVTRTTKELMEITMCDGTVIRCTPDHLFMLRSGEYTEARNLRANDSLMPLYIGENSKYVSISKAWNSQQRKIYLHQWIAEQMLGRPLQDDEVVHHKNGDKHDNRPENLEVMLDHDHRSAELRATMTTEIWKQNNAARVRDYNRSSAKREAVSAFASQRRRDSAGRFTAFTYVPEADQAQVSYNHQVRKTRLITLDEPVEVYDLTVPGYENFAVEGNVFVHNCAGWSLKQLIQEGLGGVPGKITSSPAAHLSTLCNQMVNFLGILQNEWAG